MINLSWEKCHEAFYIDGSLRDIYVTGTTFADWDEMLNFASTQSARLIIGGDQVNLPVQAQGLLEDEHVSLLEIKLGSVIANCHFFCEEEIEFDIDPRKVKSQTDLNCLVNFICGLGEALGKDVVLTSENAKDSVWYRYVAQSGELLHLNPQS